MKKRWISLLLALAMVAAMVPQVAIEARAVQSGTCGDNLTWVLDDEGTLTIRGTGAMDDYLWSDNKSVPWWNNRSDIETLIIEDGITYIGAEAFSYCENLSMVEIANTVMSIGESAFVRCSSLSSITIPQSVKHLDSTVFARCATLTNITVSDQNTSYTSIDGVVFSKDMTDILIYPNGRNGTYAIPNGVINVCEYAFLACNGLDTVIFPDSVTDIGASAFDECYHLSDISLPGNLVTVGTEAFSGCVSLSEEGIPTSVTYIGDNAFSCCDIGKEVTITENVTYIGYGAFSDCNLERIHVADNNPVYSAINGVLFSKDLSTIHTYPSAKKDIMYVVPQNVSIITKQAFSGVHALTAISLPLSTVSIENGAFFYVPNLTDVYYAGTEAQWNLVDIGAWNESLTNSTIHFGSEMPIEPPEPTVPTYPDTWSFINSYDYFGDASDGYYITTADHNRLIGNLTNTERELFYRYRYMHLYNIDGSLRPSNYLYEPYRYWGGSCYGMSSWVVLNSHHIRSASEIDSTTTYLAEFLLDPFENSNIESAINFYQFQHYLSPIQEDSNGFMALSQKAQIDILAELGKHANQTGELFLICFQGYLDYLKDGSPNLESSIAHAVVGYGWEEIDPILLTVNGKTAVYDHRIWIYDCSKTKATQDMNLYYNGGNWTWCIPGWNLISTSSQSTDSIHNNAVLELATNDVSLINTVDYTTGQANTGESVVSVTTDANARYSLGFNAVQADISGFSVSSDILDHGITVMLHPNITPDGTVSDTLATAVIPDAQEYVVTSTDDMMAYTMQNEHYLTYSALDAPGSITFMSNGNTVIQSGIVADYTINLVANDGYHASDWCEIEISGTASVVSTETSEEGIIVTSDNLTNLTVYAENDGQTLTITASSEEDSVLITENSDGNLAVCEDIDADGIYETEIAASCPFTDVPSDSFYYEPVLWALENNITTGATETTFNPTGDCLRAQVVTFLWRAAGEPSPTSSHNPFVDVAPADYYYSAVLWAVEKGITNGADATHFNPMGVCNRAQVVTFLFRTFGNPAVDATENPFTDVPADAFYAAPVLWAVENSITNGLSATEFGPNANCNRAQIVTFLYRAYN